VNGAREICGSASLTPEPTKEETEMEKLAVRLRHGTSEPIHAEVNGHLLARIRGLQTTQAIQQILHSLPEEKRTYGEAMLTTMQAADAVVEVANVADEEVVNVDRTRDEPFDQILARIARLQDGNVETLEAIEIGTARLEKGGAGLLLAGPASGRSAPGPAALGDSLAAVPQAGDAPARHPFFAAVGSVPLVIVGGRAHRLRYAPQTQKPYFLFCGERFALDEDLSVQEWDEHYFDDRAAHFEDQIVRRAAGEAAQQATQAAARRAPRQNDLPDFLIHCLAPRLRAFCIGCEKLAEADTRLRRKPAAPAPAQERSWRPQPLPLCEALPADALILAPGVHSLALQKWLLGILRPDPGVYLPRATYGIRTMLPLVEVERTYARLLAQQIENEAARRVPLYMGLLLDQQKRGQHLQVVRELIGRSRHQAAEIPIYDDPYHLVAVHQGTVYLRRRVPACVLRSAQDGSCYRAEATRLSMAVTSTHGGSLFSHGCVRADPGFRHPLVNGSQRVTMDRCDTDIDRLQETSDLCGALIKHLNDARLMLEIGYAVAPSPANSLPAMHPSDVEQSGLPVYDFRHLP
jgi:hypothetical protein